MTPTNRAIWGDAYRLMEQYENPPPGGYDENREYWDGITRGIADLCSKYRNDPMAWKLAVAIHEVIGIRYDKTRIPKSQEEAEIRADAERMLFSQQKPEQMTLL